jgi:hypothetical protein
MVSKPLEKKGAETANKKSVALPATFKPRFWVDADQRCAVVRLIKRRCAQLKEDTGADCVQKELLCQRAAFVTILLETMEVKAAENGESFDLGAYVQACNGLVGLLKSLGLEKKLKAVGDLKTYLDQKKK